MWVLLFFLLFVPYVVHAVVIFVTTLGAGLLGNNAPTPVPTSAVAFESRNVFESL